MRISWTWFSPKLVRESNFEIDYNLWFTRQYRVFRDEDIAAKCVAQCEEVYLACTMNCTESYCIMECGRALTACTLGNLI